MFRRMTAYCTIAFSLVALAWVLQICWMRQGDYEIYQSLMEKEHPVASTAESISASTHQIRQGVCKDIWFTQEDKTRLHYRIESRSSILTLLPIGTKSVDFIENLEGIKGWMQDKIYYGGAGEPMQQMRYFDADHGTYQYGAQKFVAQTVALSLFRIGGHALPQQYDPQKAFLKGVAQNVSFSISGKTPQFQAQQFKANFKQNEG